MLMVQNTRIISMILPMPTVYLYCNSQYVSVFWKLQQISLFTVYILPVYCIVPCGIAWKYVLCVHDTTEIPTVYCNSQFVLSCPLSIVILTLYCDSQFVFCILAKAVSMPWSCHTRAVIMSHSYRNHAIPMPWSCHTHIVVMPCPYRIHVIFML